MSSRTEGFGNQVAWQNMTFLQGIFTCDNPNRMTKVSDASYLRYYSYDKFGNSSVAGNYNVSPSGLTPTNPNTNHVVMVGSGGYEALGSITTLGAVTLGYDAESNVISTVGSGRSVTWIYDAEGQPAEQIIAGGASNSYVHDAFGNLAAEYTNIGVTRACLTCYRTYDVLGPVRMVTDQNQNLVARHDFIPFGEETISAAANRDPANKFGANANVKQQFTGQEADNGTASLHYFNARHLAGVLGGFVQPDPENAGGDILNPQSWNGYGYVMGNPMGLIDPSGMSIKDPTGIDGYDCFSAANANPCAYGDDDGGNFSRFIAAAGVEEMAAGVVRQVRGRGTPDNWQKWLLAGHRHRDMGAASESYGVDTLGMGNSRSSMDRPFKGCGLLGKRHLRSGHFGQCRRRCSSGSKQRAAKRGAQLKTLRCVILRPREQKQDTCTRRNPLRISMDQVRAATSAPSSGLKPTRGAS